MPLVQKPTNPNAGAGCLIVFGGVFALAGAAAFVAGVRGSMRGEHNAWVALYSGGVFAFVGACIIAAGWVGGRIARNESRLAEQFPEEPWKWKPDWAVNALRDQNAAASTVMWLVAFVVAAISLPAGVGVMHAAIYEDNKFALIGLIFPTIAIWLLGYAALLTLRKRKFGVTTFVMDTLPVTPGRVLSGTIHVPTFFHTDAVQLHLVCQNHRMQGTGKSRRTVVTTLWDDERGATPSQARASGGIEIPVWFKLPPDATVTNTADTNDRDVWELRAAASLPGADFAAKFDVPVFRDPRPRPTDPEPPRNSPNPPAQAGPGDPRVLAEPLAGGGWAIAFAPARGPGLMVLLSGVFLLFGGIAAFMLVTGESYFFGVTFGGASLLIGCLLWGIAMTRYTVRVTPDALSFRRSTPLRTRAAVWPAGEVTNVFVAPAFQHGRRAYHAIDVRLASGRKVRIASGLASRRDAQWVVQAIEQTLTGGR